jgi:hypothetical protein
MLLYISLLLMMIIVIATAVCLYRLLYNRQLFKQIKIDFAAIPKWIEYEVRQGLLALRSVSRERARQVKLRAPKGGIKSPWGW